MSGGLGDGPLQDEYRQLMKKLAQTLDSVFNDGKEGDDRTTGFVLIVFPFGEADEGRVNYISNAIRADVIATLKHQIARFEGQPDLKGNA